ncbi:histidine kinase [Tenacibaculum sp. nBUS_03]|uniref:sensor histidine kinase n=1 Tax=Tenacibaculum sp. nBUS_03 TaxID=3395320 RepID=UPI003EB89588
MIAQEPVSVNFTEKEGLPDKEFYSILEDYKGFIWLCADKGFFKYDGKTFKEYTNTLQRGLSVFNVQEGPKKRVWCNNISGQFFYVDNDKLNLFVDLKKELKGELADFVVKKSYVWVFASSKILKISLVTKQVEHIINKNQNLSVPFKYNNTIYYQTEATINSLTETNKIKDLFPTNLASKTKNGLTISQRKSTIFKIKNQLFLTQNRLNVNTFFKINTSTKNLSSIGGFEIISNYNIYTVFENGNNVWIGTNKGVWVFEYYENKFSLKKQFLKNKNITKIIKDKDDNYWCTTLNSSIYIIPNIHIETCNISSKNKNTISIDKINDNTLVFGLTNGNVGIHNIKINTSKIINLPNDDRVSKLIYHPKQNSIFISKDRSSYLLDYKTLKYTELSGFNAVKQFSIIDNQNLLFVNFNSVRLLKDADVKNKNTIIFLGKRSYTSYYNILKKETYINYVDGLVRYDSLWNSKKIHYKNKPIYGKSISKTRNNIIWVATFKDGVLGIKNEQVVEHYTINSGLTSNKVQKIKADKNKLWIALDNSIQVLDIVTKEFKTLTKRDGVLSYDISGIEVFNDKVYFSSDKGIFSIDKEKSFKEQSPEVYFNKVEINEKDTLITSYYELKHNQNAIKFGFNVNGFLYNQKGKYKYRLNGLHKNWKTTEIGKNSVKYISLPAGNYSFEVQPITKEPNNLKKTQTIKFVIKKPFWKTLGFITSVSILIFGSVVLYFKAKMKKKEKERRIQLEKLSLEKELIAINLTALRSQMNPHFIFNALNSIQDLVLKQDTDATYDSIVLFAELIRNALSYSNQDFIPINKELRFLKVYLQLEKLRFGNEFIYSINYTENKELEVPSLLIQPFIENALVHGLLHKSGKKELNIIFTFIDNILQCTIIDNGIGRVKAKKIGDRQGNHHESFALSAIEKRLKIFKKQFNEHIGYIIEDLYENDIAMGTKVIVTMPFKKQY